MAHDPRWCHEHRVEVWEFRVPDSGARITIPVATDAVTEATISRVLRGTTAQARVRNPGAEFRRRLLPYRTDDGGYEWREG